VPASVRTELTAKGHRVVAAEQALGGGQAIVVDWEQGVLQGGSDPRKDGHAAGY
jgi:gamma-glutamyltranspeptidase/glutathione hydrolase